MTIPTLPNSSADVERVIDLARDAISAAENAAHPLQSYMRRDAQAAREELFAAIRALASAPPAQADPLQGGQEQDDLPDFEDSRVQAVYEILCSDRTPPDPSLHWEGWTAQRIVAALANPPEPPDSSGGPNGSDNRLALPVVSYDAGDEVHIDRARQLDGRSLWKVRDTGSGNVLNSLGEWEWEPSPSGRDDEFLARCRYDSPEAALTALRALRSSAGTGSGEEAG